MDVNDNAEIVKNYINNTKFWCSFNGSNIQSTFNTYLCKYNNNNTYVTIINYICYKLVLLLNEVNK